MLTADHAGGLTRSALAAADRAGARVGVVVVDAGGHLLAAARHPDAYLSAVPLAQAKAFTALNFRCPTHEMAQRLGEVGYATQITLADPRLTFLPGGLPVHLDGRLVGGIGVSGGSAEADLRCGEAALAQLSRDQEEEPERLGRQRE